MTLLINVAFVAVYCVLCGDAGPSAVRLQGPGGERSRGCVQGAEVMGGAFSDLPPCPPWVDDKERCRIGDTILSRSQCLDIMTEKEYLALSRSQPETMSLPPSPPRPLNIMVSPPGWSGGGSPPGGWAQSHPPSPPGSHFGPPGISSDNMMKDTDVLPPGHKNSRWYSRRHSSPLGSMPGSVPSPPGVHVPSQMIRAFQRRNWRRRAPKTWTRRRSGNRRSRKQNREQRSSSLRRRSRRNRKYGGLSAPPGVHQL
ncbi:uncharacterized protein LOC124144237 [Haliotis rufescens]|uniref:uncharacterized protein LOC124144237 n=1 Tax=Haliotis rufescens TaxID=6454 RepID=UPI00201F02FD|nr:uncharacterized protein LOC124144237 [Haliotis rufescens]